MNLAFANDVAGGGRALRRTLARWLLAGSILLYAGCYNTETLTKEQLTATPDRDITVITKDALKYKFSRQNYRIVGDSLSGAGVQIIDVWPGEHQFNGSIPCSNIAQISHDEYNSRKTIFIVGASVFALSFVWGALVVSGYYDHH